MPHKECSWTEAIGSGSSHRARSKTSGTLAFLQMQQCCKSKNLVALFIEWVNDTESYETVELTNTQIELNLKTKNHDLVTSQSHI